MATAITPTNKKPRHHDPLRDVAEKRFAEHKADAARKAVADRRAKAKSNFNHVLESAKIALDENNEFILPADYCLVDVLAAGVIGKPVRLDEDRLTVMVNGKRSYTCGRVMFSATGAIIGVEMKHIVKTGPKGRAYQLIAYGTGVQESQWDKLVIDWHLLNKNNTAGFPRRIL